MQLLKQKKYNSALKYKRAVQIQIRRALFVYMHFLRYNLHI